MPETTTEIVTEKVLEFDDDVIGDDDAAMDGPEYLWFQRPAPSLRWTLTVTAVLFIFTSVQYARRLRALKLKFGNALFRGSLRFCASVSAYGDNEDPTFSVARLVTKAALFLALLQVDYKIGFLVMLVMLGFESALEVARVLVAYQSCTSLRDVRAAASEDEAKEIATASTELQPTNVYEDLTRPRTIAVMVFMVQVLLIGIVMYDSYNTPTRSCFNGTEGCPMLASVGSYALYFMGTFMACVFYVGPLNSYGKKEHDPVFWLKLFLMSKQGSCVVSWNDPATDQRKTMQLKAKDWRIWIRFTMSFLVNSVCFHFLLHVLPIQIASKSSIMGVVFSSVGMIYLVDLDDSTGTAMTIVTSSSTLDSGVSTTNSTNNNEYHSILDMEAQKQKIIDDAMSEVKRKLEALAATSTSLSDGQVASRQGGYENVKIQSIAQAMFLSLQKDQKKNDGNDKEGTSLLG